MSLSERVKQFSDGFAILTAWLGSGAETVSPELAQSRCDTCLQCPQNIDVAPLTERAAVEIRRQVALKDHLNLVLIGEKKLHTCGPDPDNEKRKGCGCVLKLKVHLPISRIKPDPNELENFNEQCWLRYEQ